MKNFIAVLASVAIAFIASIAIAASPPVQIDYQASISGPGGVPLEGSTDMVFHIYDAMENGNEIGRDEHLAAGTGAVTAVSGLLNVKIGSGAFVDGGGPGSYTNLLEIVRDYSEIFLQIEVNGEALLPRVQVTSAAYALNSAMLEGASLGDLQADVDTRIDTHTNDAAAHHNPYDDAQAVTAMGAKGPANPLNHDRLSNNDVVNVIGASNLVPQSACDGADNVLRWSGSEWTCEVISSGQSNGNANGFEVIDSWGSSWDGIQRTVATWTDADTSCQLLGARLPTATELFRNNATSGSGNLSDTNASSYLWTLIPNYQAASRVVLRLSDGQVSFSDESLTKAYRCVWPKSESVVFKGDACMGPAGTGCELVAMGTNMDRVDRPALSWVAASNECNFYKASLPDSRTMQEAIQSGLPNATDAWLWVGEGKYWNSNNFGVTLSKYSTTPQINWQYLSSSFGSLSLATSSNPFRCVGRAEVSIGELPVSPPCNGGCFVAMDRSFPLYSDSLDRAASDQATAAAACAASGGTLPHFQELADLAHQGWPAFPNYLWTSDPANFSPSGYGFDLYRQGGQLPENWYPTAGSASITTPDGSFAYRCIWRPQIEATPTVCAANEVQIWDGSAFQCETAVNGNSSGNATPFEIVDAWGNAWDYVNRIANTYDSALATCAAIGGTLPLPGELYRVRFQSNPLGTNIGSNEATYLWTTAPDTVITKRTTLRLSDGQASWLEMSSPSPYRCIWRSTRGDAYGARDCHGEPANPCFQVGSRRWDQYDRPAIAQTAAAYECATLGGRLPNLNDFQQLVAAGAPNGSGAVLWISETMYWDTGYGYAMGKWSGTGPGGWTYDSSAGYAGLALASDQNGFRCVFSTELK